jgi:hypothetical protein
MSPPEVVFQQAPGATVGCQKCFGLRHRCAAPVATFSSAPVTTTTTVVPTMTTAAVPFTAAVPVQTTAVAAVPQFATAAVPVQTTVVAAVPQVATTALTAAAVPASVMAVAAPTAAVAQPSSFAVAAVPQVASYGVAAMPTPTSMAAMPVQAVAIAPAACGSGSSAASLGGASEADVRAAVATLSRFRDALVVQQAIDAASRPQTASGQATAATAATADSQQLARQLETLRSKLASLEQKTNLHGEVLKKMLDEAGK